MQAFLEDEPASTEIEEGLIRADHSAALLSALDGTTIKVSAESSSLHRIGHGPLRIATHSSAVEKEPNANCVDGLDDRQWAIVRELEQPGERLPLTLVSADPGAFRVVACSWVTSAGQQEIRSFADLCELVDSWDGNEPPFGAWQTTRARLATEAREEADLLSARAVGAEESARAAQLEADRLRLIEELGRTLICFPPEAEDMNSKFHRLAADRTPTAERLRKVFARLGAYPDWGESPFGGPTRISRDSFPDSGENALTGSEVDAALSDPRWAFA